MALPHGEDDYSENSQSAYKEVVKNTAPPDHPLTLAAMMNIAADINNTFSSAITELKSDIFPSLKSQKGLRKQGAEEIEPLPA